MFLSLKDFTGLENPAELSDVARYFGKTARVWISSENKTRTTWLGYSNGNDSFDLNADDYLDGSSAVRGVAS